MRRFGGIVAAAALAMLTTAAQAQVTETLTLHGNFRDVDTGHLHEMTLDTQSEEAAGWEVVAGQRYEAEFTLAHSYPWVTRATLRLEGEFISEAVADPPVSSLTTSGSYWATSDYNARCGVMDVAIAPAQVEGVANADDQEWPKPMTITFEVYWGDAQPPIPAPAIDCYARKYTDEEGTWREWGFTGADGTVTLDVSGHPAGWWVLEVAPDALGHCRLDYGNKTLESDRLHIGLGDQKTVHFKLYGHNGIQGAIEFETFGSGYWADVELWQDGQCVQDGIVDGDANEEGKFPYSIVPPPPAGTNYTIMATYRDEDPQEKPVAGGVPNNCDDQRYFSEGYGVIGPGGAHNLVEGPNFTFYGDGGQGAPH